MKQIIQTHNRKIICENRTEEKEKHCNCRTKNNCPLDNDCKQAGIYKATVLPPHGNGEYYVGSTIDFKTRWDSHRYSFRHEEKKGATALSHHLWDKEMNENPPLKWEILANPKPYMKGGRACDLCLTEKLYICKGFQDKRQLNRRTDIALKCKHRAKHRLKKLE